MRTSRIERHGDRLLRCYTERSPSVEAMFRKVVIRHSDCAA